MSDLTDRRERIAARFAEVTGRSLASMQALTRHFLPDAFSAADGSLDVDAVDEYAAETLGGPPAPPVDPVRNAVVRARAAGGRGGGASLTERRAATAVKMTRVGSGSSLSDRRQQTRDRLVSLNEGIRR